MLLLTWIESNLIGLGLVSVVVGLAIGVVWGEYQARRPRGRLSGRRERDRFASSVGRRRSERKQHDRGRDGPTDDQLVVVG